MEIPTTAMIRSEVEPTTSTTSYRRVAMPATHGTKRCRAACRGRVAATDQRRQQAGEDHHERDARAPGIVERSAGRGDAEVTSSSSPLASSVRGDHDRTMSLAPQQHPSARVAARADGRAERTRDILGVLAAMAVVSVIALLTVLFR